jgi:hypothetical protein
VAVSLPRHRASEAYQAVVPPAPAILSVAHYHGEAVLVAHHIPQPALLFASHYKPPKNSMRMMLTVAKMAVHITTKRMALAIAHKREPTNSKHSI